jgi:hypothetical protein
MSFYEYGFYSLEKKVNIEGIALPYDPTASKKNETLDPEIEIKEEIQETFQINTESRYNFVDISCALEKEPEKKISQLIA